MKKFIHIDMDCFYAAVEMRDNPMLADKPIAIGGHSRRGVISTANYVARQYGVRSAMSNYQAKKLCPELIMVPGRMQVYKEVSKEIRRIFYQYTELVEPLSLDEAYLDVTGTELHSGSATLMAQAIREQIYQTTGLTASAGIAPIKFIAKITSDLNKPNGQYVVKPEQVAHFLAQLDLGKIPGVGKVTLNKLNVMGLYRGQDVLDRDEGWLVNRFGQFGSALYRKCAGLSEGQVQVDRLRKSLSVEHTYERDLLSLEVCQDHLTKLLAELKVRLERQNLVSRISKLTVKVKFSDFVSTTADQVGSELNIEIFKILLAKAYARGGNKSVRLLGLGVGISEVGASPQLRLDC